MDVRIITFPETQVAFLRHTGGSASEHETVRKLVAWKLENKLMDPVKHRHYGLHYFEREQAGQDTPRVDFCLSVDEAVAENIYGVEMKTIPQMRCASARDIGSRLNNQAARYLFEQWLPSSGEKLSGYPLIFHYVNVGPAVSEAEAVTDVFVPITVKE